MCLKEINESDISTKCVIILCDVLGKVEIFSPVVIESFGEKDMKAVKISSKIIMVLIKLF